MNRTVCQWNTLVIFCFIAAAGVADCAMTLAGGRAELRGTVTDAGGRTVEGAMVFLYAGPDVRKPADFISAYTERDGTYRMVVLPGRYRAVARLKTSEGFGPLMPGDKHSGEPREVELDSGKVETMNFIVADLREALRAKTKTLEGPVRVSGKIVNGRGEPVSGAYVIAHRNEAMEGIPDYVSAESGRDGRFSLLVPRGRYFIGSAVTFPPDRDYEIHRELAADSEISDLNLLRRSPGAR